MLHVPADLLRELDRLGVVAHDRRPDEEPCGVRARDAVPWKPKYDGEEPLCINGEPSSVVLGRGIRVRLVPTADDVARIMFYQDSLTKAGKPRKR
ncbi:hypothetical protein FDH38_gp024 [Dinoroseobacter phage vB_DshS-R5C]|uniref:Uncharacterized protein n=1 Tax=Dinoroseobacter phage vB_DshS-R5C TaxID=1965368 RepID=A0A1V0DY69_9CAUD|nr:hypothetical protein FDH38_gp024 [Dinoroseobacter phage vB_DshS-R5C]ARB06078.1 hypothetical protein vBDshSR5C_24 [Dinoroseobacter phage vB_DshS-R5C]